LFVVAQGVSKLANDLSPFGRWNFAPMPLSLLGCCNSLVVLFCCGGAKGGYGLPIHWGIGHDGLSAAESAVSNPDSGVVGRDAKALKKSGNFHEA
jgi:hypothetical protein